VPLDLHTRPSGKTAVVYSLGEEKLTTKMLSLIPEEPSLEKSIWMDLGKLFKPVLLFPFSPTHSHVT
jgi:hypothetical protein